MSQPTAIQLSLKTVDVITEALVIPRNDVLEELGTALLNESHAYYVRNVVYGSNRLPYLIYNEHDFLADFATVPKGIEDHFVPVLQVKADS